MDIEEEGEEAGGDIVDGDGSCRLSVAGGIRVVVSAI